MKFSVEKLVKNKLTIDGQSFWRETVEEIVSEMYGEICLDDNLEISLIFEEPEFGFFDEETTEMVHMLYSPPTL